MMLMAIGGPLQRKRDKYVRQCMDKVPQGWRMVELLKREFERGWFEEKGYLIDGYVSEYIVRVRSLLDNTR